MSAGHVAMVVAGLLGLVLTLRLLASADDTHAVVVAASDLTPGTVIDADALTTARVGGDAGALASLFAADDLDGLDGRVVVTHVEAGSLLTRADVRDLDDGAAPRALSFAIPRARAVAGELRAGDRVDVIGIDGDTGAASYVVRDVEVLGVRGDDGPLGSGGDEITMTVAADADAALAVAAAVESGAVSIVRTTGATAGGPDDRSDGRDDPSDSRDDPRGGP